MAADNGSGNGGGNSSVWWEIRHGSQKKKQLLEAIGFGTPVPASAGAGVGVIERPASGQVKLSNAPDRTHSRVEIHDRTGLADIGAPDHTGMFRVRLRIRKAELDALIAKENDSERRRRLEGYRTALPQLARALQTFTGPPPVSDGETLADDDFYLVIDVPAIERKPGDGEPWPHLPWEIYWQW